MEVDSEVDTVEDSEEDTAVLESTVMGLELVMFIVASTDILDSHQPDTEAMVEHTVVPEV